MGTWGHEYHANDDAADFLDEVSSTRDWRLVSARINDYVNAGGYDDGQATVAALELVATALGKPPEGIDAELAIWATSNLPDAENLRDKALIAVDFIAQKSELSELWAEDEVNKNDAASWRGVISNLKNRIEK